MSTSATTSPPTTLRLGTRGSLLARTQSGLVANELEKLHPGLAVELITVKTTGDRITDRPLNEVGGKGLFTKELEQALLAGEVDFAVHSFKDVPVTMPLVDTADLMIAAVPVREDPSDVLVSLRAKSIEELPQGAKVGTSSLRRRCQLLDRRADLSIQPLRGNIDTRLRKLRDGDYDAVILAAAGLRRVGMWDEQIMTRLGAEMMLPAAAQGALALQCRRDDARTRDLLAVMNDSTTAACVAAEREVVNALDGDCHSPIAALATIDRGSSSMHLRVAVGARGGELPVARSAARGPAADASSLVTQAVKLLAAQGVAPGASSQD
jgi:hydroxymethylbilane synthase